MITVWSCAGYPATRRCWPRTGPTHAADMARLRGYLDLAAELQHPGERLTVSTTSGGAPEDWERVKGMLVDRFGELAAVRAARRGADRGGTARRGGAFAGRSKRSGCWSR